MRFKRLTTPVDMRHSAVRSHTRAYMAFIIFLLAVGVLLAFSATAGWADDADTDKATLRSMSCIGGVKDAKDYSYCLPSGRWGNQVGTISTRVESAGGIGGGIVDMFNNMAAFTRTIMPNMLLQITQVFWSGALAISQFAASFAPMNNMGKTIDGALGGMIDSVMSGGLPMAFIILAILSIIAASAWNIGTEATAVKRLGVTILCIAITIGMGTAAKDDATKDTPTAGSPWWVVSTMNSTINKIAGSIFPAGAITENNSYMMAYDESHDNPDKRSCQSYLYAMHEKYRKSGVKDVAASTNLSQQTNTSAFTEAVNILWEETALRSWVDMQYGGSDTSGGVSPAVASNAMQSYCHVLEAQAGTDPVLQTALTNMQLNGVNSPDEPINIKTGRYLFDVKNGFITSNESKILDSDDKAIDTTEGIARQRMNIFWQTCGYQNGEAYARDGWKQLVNNLGDKDTTSIKGSGGAILRYTTKGSDAKEGPVDYINANDVLKDNFLWDENGDGSAVTKLCKAVINDNALFQNDADSTMDVHDKEINTNDAMAGVFGWTFDVPNAGSMWREANLHTNSGNELGMKTTINAMYGNSTANSLNATGTVMGSIVNFAVWGLFSLALMLAKLMLCFSIMSLVAAFIIQAFPIGEKSSKALVNWAKSTCSYAMVGVLYSGLGYIAVLIVQCIISACGGASGTFFYNLLAGCSPALALIVIAGVCKQLKLGNPFSIKAVATMAGGGALAGVLAAGMGQVARSAIFGKVNRAMGTFGSHGKSDGRLSSSENAGSGGAKESAAVNRKAADEQQAMHGDSVETATTSKSVAADGNGESSVEETKELDQNQSRHDDDVNRYMKSGATTGAAEALADRNAALRNMGGKLHGLGSNMVNTIKNKPLRKQMLRKGIKTAAKVGATVAAFSNPITAPLGLMSAAHMATRRENWRRVGHGLMSAARATPGAMRFAKTMAAPLKYTRTARTAAQQGQRLAGAVSQLADEAKQKATKGMVAFGMTPVGQAAAWAADKVGDMQDTIDMRRAQWQDQRTIRAATKGARHDARIADKYGTPEEAASRAAFLRNVTQSLNGLDGSQLGAMDTGQYVADQWNQFQTQQADAQAQWDAESQRTQANIDAMYQNMDAAKTQAQQDAVNSTLDQRFGRKD